MARILVAALLAVGMVGCAGSAEGKVAGHNLAVADAVFATLKDDDGKNLVMLLVMADKPNLCDGLKANRTPKEATSLTMQMVRVGGGEILAPDVGEYTVRDSLSINMGNNATADFGRQDSSCTDTVANSAGESKSGLIKITNLRAEKGGTANGTYDISFGDGALKGSFNASYCDINVLATGNPSCE
ncbi:MAG: hypothetical protein ACO1OB_31860 [Archangium sp.]